jgi:hypothetical protein
MTLRATGRAERAERPRRHVEWLRARLAAECLADADDPEVD